ncbi:MAG TPA: Wzz/FepE/Etk N-terminal domain-containing protein [Blastocatellia bacterium]|nr:Wzz/FepE/Etk N-terminal domain-containing protein [Blastocatellia bacterium]
MYSIRPRTLAEYTGLFWRRKKLLLLIVAIFLLCALVAINRVPDVYESQALIVVGGELSEETRQAGIARINAITQQMLSRTNLQPLIRRYGLYGDDFDSDAAIERMRRDIRLDVRRRSYYPEVPEAVAVAYRHVNPETARQVLADLITVFERANDDLRRQATNDKNRLAEQLTEVEGQIRKLGQSGSGAAMVTDTSYIRAKQAEIVSSVAALGDRQYALQRQAEDLKKQIDEQQKLARISTTATGAGSLLVRKAELEAQLKDYARQYTDKNPKVIQSRTQLEEVNKQISQLTKGADQGEIIANSSEARELRALQRELHRTETDLEVTRREMDRRRQSLSSVAVGAPRTIVPPSASFLPGAEAGFLFSRYNSLMEKHDYIQRLEGASGTMPAPFQVVDVPDLPQTPIAPNRLKLQAIAVIMALGIALLAIAAVELPRLRLLSDVRDIEYFLGSPVIALIPESLTPDERGRARRLRLMRRAGVLLIVTLLVPTVVFVLHGLHFFQYVAFR